MKAEKTLRICEKGHKFYKSSDCQSCPTCDKEHKPNSGFLSKLSSPARNALLHDGIDTLQKLSTYTEKEILRIHGMGPKSIPNLKSSLEEEGLTFKEN
ncbi:RNA polymerase alpha subunit C-terminal domain-containing protein [Ureibacillus acetophenoni]|uniref:RNA polymerase alpha subunit n=1 Tax=Ureibacillus acetophenoni TaxID=614649 RepID=A0A285ULB8_9BACL|nr:RNA polymerase alpha subunit C-terminal domain-containing protein [Ureibacillus acetophenoni]SOC42695.1 RNA polymerase alpha subunit [Ureibacillus acetophenoni]